MIAVDNEKLQSILSRHRNSRHKMIAILQDIQAVYRYLPEEALRFVSTSLKVPLIDVVGVATFYRAFSLTPRGEHICKVCLGTACHVRGGPKILAEVERILEIKAGETTRDEKFTLETVACLGCCAIGPVLVVDDEYHAPMTVRKVTAVLEKYGKRAPA